MSMMWSVRVDLPSQGGGQQSAASGLWWYTGWCRPAAPHVQVEREHLPRRIFVRIWWRVWVRYWAARGRITA